MHVRLHVVPTLKVGRMQPQNIPEELKRLPQWVCRNEAKQPINPHTGFPASVNDRATWGRFEQVQEIVAEGRVAGGGFVLTETDPYTFIDLDVKPGEEPTEEQLWVYKTFESYSERSPSGTGLHIILKGAVPSGRRRGKIEVYSSGRYMTMTGNVDRDLPILDFNERLAELWAYLGGSQADDTSPAPIIDPNPAAPITDERHVELICGSPVNAAHYNGTSGANPSEATFALICAACLFSSDEAQVRRVVLASPLVQNSPTKDGETRAEKVQRLWGQEYPKAARRGAQERQERAQAAAHGAQLVAGLRQPVDLFGVLQPTPLPEGVLPQGIDYLARAMAAEMGCDPAGVAVAMLGAAAGVIPDRVGVKVKDNWRERACIWPMLVGSPSTKKSPMIRAAKAPIVKEDLRRFKAWKQADTAWQALDKEGQKATPRPVMSRLILGDATTEAAQEALRVNRDGLVHITEEASGWLAGMERNGKASGLDRSFWLQAYDGGEFAYDRIGRGSVVIENLSIGLIAAIQPEKIRDVVNNAADDGLIQRTIPIILRPATMSADEGDDGTQIKNAELYAELVKECATFDFGFTSIPLSQGAKIVRRRVERRVHEMQSLEIISRKLASHIGKYEGLFARFCLIFHVLDYTSAKVAKQETTFQELFQISENCALRVERFVFEFLLPHAASFYQNVVGGLDDKDALESIANYILAHGLTEIDARTVYRGDRSLRKLSNFQITPLFEQLTALGWIEPVEGPQRRSTKHVVNPQVHILFAQRARVEADRREKAKVAMSAIFGAAASRDNGDKA